MMNELKAYTHLKAINFMLRTWLKKMNSERKTTENLTDDIKPKIYKRQA